MLLSMKARYRYRIYPTPGQQLALAKLFGCCRVVWNDALAFCNQQYQRGEKKLKNGELQKRFITQVKKTVVREWLTEVSNIPPQQSLNDLEQAYQNFFKSCKGKRKGKPSRPPRFKKRHARQSARFRQGGFKSNQKLKLAKIGKVKVAWSRQLPAEPRSVTIVKDGSGSYFASFVVEVQPEVLPKTSNSVGIDLGITTFAILDSGEKIEPPKPLRTYLEGKAEKYGRELQVINRWEPTSQTCSCCGFPGGKKDLSVRTWTCLKCETTHDRDVNAAVMIELAGGHSESLNGRGGRRKSSAKGVAARESSTQPEFIQLSLFE